MRRTPVAFGLEAARRRRERQDWADRDRLYDVTASFDGGCRRVASGADVNGARFLAVAVTMAVSGCLPMGAAFEERRQELEAALALATQELCEHERSVSNTEDYTELVSRGIVSEPVSRRGGIAGRGGGSGDIVVLAVDTVALRATGAGIPDVFFHNLAVGYHCTTFHRTGRGRGSGVVSFVELEGGRVLARVRELLEVERPPFEESA